MSRGPAPRDAPTRASARSWTRISSRACGRSTLCSRCGAMTKAIRNIIQQCSATLSCRPSDSQEWRSSAFSRSARAKKSSICGTKSGLPSARSATGMLRCCAPAIDRQACCAKSGSRDRSPGMFRLGCSGRRPRQDRRRLRIRCWSRALSSIRAGDKSRKPGLRCRAASGARSLPTSAKSANCVDFDSTDVH